MRIFRTLLLSACAAGLLAGCGGGGSTGSSVNTSTTRGTLIQNPPLRVASVNATDLTKQLNNSASGQGLLTILQVPNVGTPNVGSLPCGVDYHYIQYATVGGAGEATTATGVLMVPTAPANATQPILNQCTGLRPIVLYAHGTSTVKSYNLAAVGDPTNDAYSESALIGAMFAAQGYIVVAPNYAGYDTSTLPYHPYLNADQQSKDMIDALTAARSALGHVFASGTTDNHKLFITGYSQGGYVAMATQQALENLGQTVTAAAPMSGPYAMEAFGDAILLGSVDIGSTVFIPMITTSYQKSYGGIYNLTSDIYESAYATGIETLLPNTSPIATLFAQSKLPQLALFNSTTPTPGNGTTPSTGNNTLDAELTSALALPSNQLFQSGFGSSNLMKNSVRIAYGADALVNQDGAIFPQAGAPLATSTTYPLRTKLQLNDMRYKRYPSSTTGFVPQHPTLLCGGSNDPTVFFSVNAGTMQAYWAPMLLPNGLVTVLDLETGLGNVDPFTQAEGGFAQTIAGIKAQAVQAGATDGGVAAATQAYHDTVAPFCTAAALGFFSQF